MNFTRGEVGNIISIKLLSLHRMKRPPLGAAHERLERGAVAPSKDCIECNGFSVLEHEPTGGAHIKDSSRQQVGQGRYRPILGGMRGLSREEQAFARSRGTACMANRAEATAGTYKRSSRAPNNETVIGTVASMNRRYATAQARCGAELSRVRRRFIHLSHPAATGVENGLMTVLADRHSPGHADMRGKDEFVGLWPTGGGHGFDRIRHDSMPTAFGLMTGASLRQRSRSCEPWMCRSVTDARPDCESPPETTRRSATCIACSHRRISTSIQLSSQ